MSKGAVTVHQLSVSTQECPDLVGSAAVDEKNDLTDLPLRLSQDQKMSNLPNFHVSTLPRSNVARRRVLRVVVSDFPEK